MIKYLVERYPNDSDPIICATAEESIQTAENVGGAAWEKTVERNGRGVPFVSWRMYVKADKRWKHQ